jgi:hypothetical protein
LEYFPVFEPPAAVQAFNFQPDAFGVRVGGDTPHREVAAAATGTSFHGTPPQIVFQIITLNTINDNDWQQQILLQFMNWEDNKKVVNKNQIETSVQQE